MAMKWFLVSTKAKNLKFEIVELDKATMRAKLKGDTGVPFERDLSGDTLAKYGYKIEKIEVPDGEAVGSQ
ncbi:MAG: hypothetical protein ACKO0Z_01055 [Betaproteobacteria bacterium]